MTAPFFFFLASTNWNIHLWAWSVQYICVCKIDRGITVLLRCLAPRQHFCSSAKDSRSTRTSISMIWREGKKERRSTKICERDLSGWFQTFLFDLPGNKLACMVAKNATSSYNSIETLRIYLVRCQHFVAFSNMYLSCCGMLWTDLLLFAINS